MPAPYPQEFRDDVVRVARSRVDGVAIAQIAKDFGVHETTLRKQIRQADIDDGQLPAGGREESTELREARERIRLLEQESVCSSRRTKSSAAQSPTSRVRICWERSSLLVSELAVDAADGSAWADWLPSNTRPS